MTSRATALKITFIASLAAFTLSSDALPAKRKPQTQAEVNCWNQATNDYYAQLKECETALSDIPQQLDQCKSDARQDMDRRQNQCVKAAKTGKGSTHGIIGKPPAAKAP